MKKFILNFIIFTSLLLIITYSSILLVNEKINRSASFKLSKPSKNIILGHSHPECAFNDSLISNFSNCAQSGESYFYTYFKLKKIIEQNKNIKVVFIEFSNKQVDFEMNNWIWGDMFMSYYFSMYSPFMNLSDNWLLFKNNNSEFIKDLSFSLKNNFSTIVKNDFEYTKRTGGYLYLKKSKTDSLITCLKKSPFEKIKYVKHSLSSIEYLNKIIEYCKRNSIKVYLIRSPLHNKCEEYMSEYYFDQFRLLHYSNEEFLDFSKFPLLNSEFADLEHLNYRGARKFSFWFNQLIKQGLLNHNNKQQIINQKIKLLTKSGNSNLP
jgi:hypothetical protein